MHTIIDWLEAHQLSCFFVKTFGIECPGCGTQRAFIFLLKGEFFQSFHAYPPLMLFIFLFSFLFVHLFFKLRNGGMWLKYTFVATAASVLINFIYRLIAHA